MLLHKNRIGDVDDVNFGDTSGEIRFHLAGQWTGPQTAPEPCAEEDHKGRKCNRFEQPLLKNRRKFSEKREEKADKSAQDSECGCKDDEQEHPSPYSAFSLPDVHVLTQLALFGRRHGA